VQVVQQQYIKRKLVLKTKLLEIKKTNVIANSLDLDHRQNKRRKLISGFE